MGPAEAQRVFHVMEGGMRAERCFVRCLVSIDHIRNDNEPILRGWEVLTVSWLAGLTQVDAGTLPGSAVDALHVLGHGLSPPTVLEIWPEGPGPWARSLVPMGQGQTPRG